MNTPSKELLDCIRAMNRQMNMGNSKVEFLLDLENQMFDAEDFLNLNGCDPLWLQFMEKFIVRAREYLRSSDDWA